MTISGTPPTIHPEDEPLISQLASLQRMHDQIYHLRTLPQGLLNPVSDLLRTQTLASISPDAAPKLYAKIQSIAVQGLRDVESFKQSWSSDEMQALWRRTENEPCPQGSDVWRVDYISALRNSRAYDRQRAFETAIAATDSREAQDILHDFREKHPSIKLESEAPKDGIPFIIRIAGMTFRVVTIGKGDKRQYEVQYNQGSRITQLQDGILRHMNQRRAKGNLEYLLNMITSYADVKGRPCDKCHKLFDKGLKFPVIRTQTLAAFRKGETDIHWEAMHADCV